MITLDSKYKAILFITLENETQDTFDYLATNLENDAKEYDILLDFSGLTFGSYDWTIEFTHNSAKAAAYICSKILETLSERKIVNSGSFLICKKLISNSIYNDDYDDILRSYTFIRSEKFFNYNFFKSVAEKKMLKDNLIFFNISQYPLLVINHGNELNSIFKKVINFRLQYENVIEDTSTRLTIKYNSIGGPNKDTTLSKDINAYINIKVNKIAYLEDVRTYLENKVNIVTERQGWFDIIAIKKINSVHILHDFIMQMRIDLKDKILHTSTFFEMNVD